MKSTALWCLTCLVALMLLVAFPPRLSAQGTTTITNPGFETYTAYADRTIWAGIDSGNVATGWFDNAYWCNTTMTYTNDSTVKHTGSYSQKLSLVSTDWTVQYARNVTLATGHTYVASLWMKASTPTKVAFKIRGNGDTQDTTMHDYFTKTVVIDTNWQQVTIGGVVTLANSRATEGCFLMIEYGYSGDAPYTGVGGNLWLDDASFADTTTPARTSTSNVVTNSGSLEGTYVSLPKTNSGLITGVIAPGWFDNTSYWLTTSSSDYSQETVGQHSGTGCQKIQHNAATLQFATKITPPSGKIYSCSVWLKSLSTITVGVAVQGISTSKTYATKDVVLGTTWQEVKLCVVPGGELLFIQISTNALGTIYIDDVSFVDVTPPLAINPVSDEFFGMHFGLDKIVGWPVTAVGTWRLWDTGACWIGFQPNAPAVNDQAHRRDTANWNGTTLTYSDTMVDAAVAHNTVPIMVLGMTPTWATDYRGPNYYGDSVPGMPKDLAYWADYVWVLGNRYKGKIHHWEIWNEPNDPYFFSGLSTGTYTVTMARTITPETKAAGMAILTASASAILKAIDPSNQILAPSATGPTTNFLDAYLATGAASYCDIIGYHYYADSYNAVPETIIQRMGEVRQSLAANGVYDKPVWCTEQGYFGNGTTQLPFDSETAKGYVARIFLLNWAFGSEGRLQFYRWECGSSVYLMPLTLTSSDPLLNCNTLSPAGTAHATVLGWLKGGAIMKAVDRDASGTWHIRIERPYSNTSYIGHIVWNETATTTYTIPAAWGGNSLTRKRLLDGTSSTVSLTTGSTVSIGIVPILLETVAP